MMMDPLDAVLDEVALEGLDGISIQTLWLRLRSRQPEFGLNLDPLSQQFLWSCLIRAAEIRFYLLPEDRRAVTLHDRAADAGAGAEPVGRAAGAGGVSGAGAIEL
ncbi:hypothetical protein G5714_000001 [Onychostoma macrolepis]|uniref:General transcription factor 3C polypeptide 1 winged-helix domain-containing protein n=1 Tax=Onychostoma macrolepis TaxID=369639 RepID=A0A7J6DF94_9TELE|nr:hypothetical protein G5714_000001 [Onychostoma macrolepis]